MILKLTQCCYEFKPNGKQVVKMCKLNTIGMLQVFWHIVCTESELFCLNIDYLEHHYFAGFGHPHEKHNLLIGDNTNNLNKR